MEMSDEVKKAKAVRVSKRGVFTRKKNHLQQLLDGGALPENLKKAYDDMAESFKVLEDAHEHVLIAVEEHQMEAEETYLDGLANDLSAMHVKVTTSAQTHDAKEAQEKEIADKAALTKALKSAVASFKV